MRQFVFITSCPTWILAVLLDGSRLSEQLLDLGGSPRHGHRQGRCPRRGNLVRVRPCRQESPRGFGLPLEPRKNQGGNAPAIPGVRVGTFGDKRPDRFSPALS